MTTAQTDNPYAPPKAKMEEDRQDRKSWIETYWKESAILGFVGVTGVALLVAKCSEDKDVGDTEQDRSPQSKEMQVVDRSLSKDRGPDIHEVDF